MARVEKTVFISYRRTDVYTALAVYENLKNQGLDVFFDYKSISSGDFEQVITSNIRARAHFILILTPTALDRCNEPGDWLRREIETAIDEKRNIVPLFFGGFQFGASSRPGISRWLRLGNPDVLTGKLEGLSRYNGLNVHEDYFEEAMNRLRTEYLSKPLDTVLHPVSTEVQKVVREEQIAADEALKHKEEIKEQNKTIGEKPDKLKADSAPPHVKSASVAPSQQPKKEEKSSDEKAKELERLKSQAVQYELLGDFWNAQQTYYKIKKLDPGFPRVDAKIKELERELQPKPSAASSVPHTRPASGKGISWRLVGGIAGAFVAIFLCIWGGISFWNNLFYSSPEPTRTLQPTITQTSHPTPTRTPKPTATHTSLPVKTNTPSTTPTPKPDINDPQGEPVSVWKDIPIMPQAINGYELVDRDSYSFTVKATPVEIATYYHEKLARAGWTTRAGWFIYSEKEGLGTYRNGELRLDFTISAHGDLSLVGLSFSFNIE